MDKNFLTKQQEKAIKHQNGPLLIIAGAGTGKTTVITERIKHLILEEKINPQEILALTFTEKAAKEMEERVDNLMPYGYTQMWIMTFHSFCEVILREEAISIGLNPGYKLMTEAESIMFLKKNIFNLNLKYYKPLGNPTKFLEALIQHFSRLKDEDISTKEYLEYASKITKDNSTKLDKEEILKINELARAYDVYEQIKAKEGKMDFSDLISNTLMLLRKRENILKKYQNQFKYILVDEFQDTNYAQNELAILLSGKDKNITVVADDDQAIYRWRGAAISNVIQFKKNFPGTKVITLTENFRSTQEILDKAYQLIQNNNPNRLEVIEKIDKKLISQRKIKGKGIELLYSSRVEEETEQIAKTISDLVKKENINYKDIAILVRANNHSQPIISTLHRNKIPYQFLGPGQLFQQDEIKDLIAYLKVLYDLSDSISLYRVLNMEVFNISAREINYILSFSKRNNLTLFETLEKARETFLDNKTKEKLKTITEMILRHINLVKNETAGQILYYFLSDSGLFKQLLDFKTQKEEKVAQNIAKFFDKIKNYETQNDESNVYSVVDWIDLMMQMGDSPLAAELDWKDYNAVNILTVHSSKGLEFPVVFLTNLVQDRFPTRERREKIPIPNELIKEIIPEGDYHLQEERRLFYVGMTRAKDLLYFTASNYYGEGKKERKISPFILETIPEKIPKKNVNEKIKQLSLIELAQGYQSTPEKDLDVTALKLSSISYSQIQSFDICPLHFKLRYILGIPGPVSHSQSFGITIHSTLKDFYQSVKNGQKPSEEKIIEIMKNKWISKGYESKEHENENKERAIDILKKFYKNSFDIDNIPQELETPFSFYLDNLKVSGKIDRIDMNKNGDIEIIDYKTGQAKKESKSYLYDFQLGIYALATKKVNHRLINSNKKITLTLFYLETGEKIQYQTSSEELIVWEQKIKDKVKEIESSDFKCSKNILCSNCEYKIICNSF